MLVLDHNPALCDIRHRRGTPDCDPAKAQKARLAIQRLCWITIQHSTQAINAEACRIVIRQKRKKQGSLFNARAGSQSSTLRKQSTPRHAGL